MSTMKEYTIAEVATHNTREDLFLIIRDEVYEVSKFLTEVKFHHRFKYADATVW
jgi:cytochrome b involved in lipid metabolism